MTFTLVKGNCYSGLRPGKESMLEIMEINLRVNTYPEWMICYFGTFCQREEKETTNVKFYENGADF